MPIHLLWGDDEAARNRAVEALVTNHADPAWASINVSRLDGSDAAQAAQALEEARTPPFGGGARVVVLQRSPFCSACPAELAALLEVLRASAVEAGRDPGAIEITSGGRGVFGPDQLDEVKALADLGVDRVVVPAFLFWNDPAASLAAFGEQVIAKS